MLRLCSGSVVGSLVPIKGNVVAGRFVDDKSVMIDKIEK